MPEKILKRPTIIDGFFYPDDFESLSSQVKTSLTAFGVEKTERPFALISPFASYIYASQAFAASYSQVINESYDTAVVISPMHKMAFPGIALTESDCFSSPLGDLYVDKEANAFLEKYNNEYFFYGEKYHLQEHGIEVQLPYVYTALGPKIKILPLILGETNTKFTTLFSKVLFSMIQETKKRYLFIVATDLSHDLKYDKAVAMDNKLVEILKTMKPDYFSEQLALKQIEAFGGGGIIVLLRLAEMLGGKKIRILKQINSGDITFEKHKVEGYLSAAFY